MSQGRRLIFLGAGSSVPLGLPTMVQLADRFEETVLNNQKHLTYLIKAKQMIRRNNFSYDVESLYNYLSGSADPFPSLRRAGPFAASKCKTQPISRLRRSRICEKMREGLEEHLIKECYLGEEYEKRRTVVLFNRLLTKISGVTDWENGEPDWRGTVFEVFTTNYDNAVERYGFEVGQIPFVGYAKTARDKVRFVPEQYDTTSAKIKLHKIHGSIELSLLDDGSVIAVEPPKAPGEKHHGRSIKAKVMVYGPNKNIISEPYFELLSRLKKCLKEIHECVVVGYSFRDPWINQIFSDVVSHRSQTTPWIEYISPSAESTILSRLPNIQSSVRPVNRTLQQYLNLPGQF